MKTKPLYLNDSYLKEMDTQVLEVIQEGMNQYRLLLEETVFYPMGGGQPTDQGKLIAKDWQTNVYQVMMKNGEIWHYLKTPVAPKVGDTVHGNIDWNRRYKNMRIHSAGHVIDFAMYLLHYSPKQLSPLKADHGKKAFIIYRGVLNEDIQGKLEQKTNELVGKNLKFSWIFQPLEDLQKEAIYLQPGLPTDKPLRTLRLETVGAVADGGTQVHTTQEVGKIIINAIETQNGQTIIRYSLQV
jgi:alanyl-tRNA synthetase